jgi:hypothetical protein
MLTISRILSNTITIVTIARQGHVVLTDKWDDSQNSECLSKAFADSKCTTKY